MRGASLAALLLLLGCGGGESTATAPSSPDAATPAPVPAPAPAATPAPVASAATPGAVPTIDALPAPTAVKTPPGGLRNGDFVPELQLTDLLTDTPYTLSEHLGPKATRATRAAVIGFVASWCGPCRASLPTLAEIKEEHGDDVQIVLLATDTDRAGRLKEAEHVRKAGLDAVVLDPTPEVLRAYRGRKANVPKFYIVNKIGEVLVQDTGFGRKVKPMLPKQVRYALNHPEYVERRKPRKKRSPTPGPS